MATINFFESVPVLNPIVEKRTVSLMPSTLSKNSGLPSQYAAVAGVIVYNLETPSTMHLLNSFRLNIVWRITRGDGTNLKADDVVAPINGCPASLFRDISLRLNQTLIEGGTNTFAEKSYFLNTFTKRWVIGQFLMFVCSKQYQKHQLAYLTAYAKDDPGRFDHVDQDEESIEKKNSGFVARMKQTALSLPVNSYFELPLDFCGSNAPILPNSNIQITLVHHSDGYRLAS